jgi:transposase-like protein
MKKQTKRKSRVPELTPLQQEIIASIRSGKSLMGEGGVLTSVIKGALEAVLEGELESHLSVEGDKRVYHAEPTLVPSHTNRRNGKSSKTMRSEHGTFELVTPRDRESSFDPQLVKKRQTVLTDELDSKILALFGLGMSYAEISSHVKDMYAYEVSPTTISAVTDKLIPLITEWRSRPLEALYPIVFLDAMFFKTREGGEVKTKAIYNILGIDKDGHKEILGFYAAESEGANFWLGVLNDLRQRGVKDILIACIDGLKGFPEAINTLFPHTEIQLCIVHQIRNSLKYVASRDQKEFMGDLKDVYKAPSKDAAEYNLLKLDEKWGKKYPAVLKSWNNNWHHLSAYFKYSAEIRKMIYTTNAIEGFHRQVRKYTKTKGAFTSENALFKQLFCAIERIKEKWTHPIQNWALTISQLHIYFGDRVVIDLKN